MKGFIEKILIDTVVVLVPVLIIVGVHAGNLLMLVDGGRQLDSQFAAVEIASTLSVMQGGPDGMMRTYGFPAILIPGCIKIYQTYVEVHTSALGPRAGEAELVQRANFTASIERSGMAQGQPIETDCPVGMKLVLRKQMGKIQVSVE